MAQFSFVNFPNRTFFGLDKGSSHSITIPAECNEFFINYFKLSENSLQKEISMVIEGHEVRAEIRLARILNIRPHRKVRNRRKRDVLKLQWKKFSETKNEILVHYGSIREQLISGKINKTCAIKYTLTEQGGLELTLI